MILGYTRLHGRGGHEAGRQLLSRLYTERTGAPLPPILRTPEGKPYFPDSPWHFSISHTRRHAFCVLSRNNVAVDAEELDRRVDLRLAQKVLSPGELAQFEAAGDKARALLVFSLCGLVVLAMGIVSFAQRLKQWRGDSGDGNIIDAL